VVQGGFQYDFQNTAYLKVAPAYYKFDNLKGNSFTWSAGSNSTDKNGKLIYDYNLWAFDGEAGYYFSGPVQKAALFGQYIKSDADDNDTGYLLGAKIGSKKIKEFGDWELKYNYRRLEKDACPDFLPDSDFYSGATNAEGHEVEFTFGLAKHVSVGLDYYFDVKPIEAPEPKKTEEVLQLDLLVKF